MEVRGTVYFDQLGRKNTKDVAQAVRTRCQELGINHVVLASSSGKTALAFHEALQGLDVTLVAVAPRCGTRPGLGKDSLEDKNSA